MSLTPIEVYGLPDEPLHIGQVCKEPITTVTSAEAWAHYLGLSPSAVDWDMLWYDTECYDSAGHLKPFFCNIYDFQDPVKIRWEFAPPWMSPRLTQTQPGECILVCVFENDPLYKVWTADKGTTENLEANYVETTSALVRIVVDKSPVERIPECLTLLPGPFPDETKTEVTFSVCAVSDLEICEYTTIVETWVKRYYGMGFHHVGSVISTCEAPASLSILSGVKRGTDIACSDNLTKLPSDVWPRLSAITVTAAIIPKVLQVGFTFALPTPSEDVPHDQIGREWVIPAKDKKYGMLQAFQPYKVYIIDYTRDVINAYDSLYCSPYPVEYHTSMRNVAVEYYPLDYVEAVMNYSGGRSQLLEIIDSPPPNCTPEQSLGM